MRRCERACRSSVRRISPAVMSASAAMRSVLGMFRRRWRSSARSARLRSPTSSPIQGLSRRGRGRRRNCPQRLAGMPGYRHGLHHHQGGDPRRRDGNAIPARHQGDAEGDAAGRRQAGHSVRGRGGRRRGPHGRAHDHRPQQDGAREPLRPRRRARGAAAREGRHRAAGEGQLLERAGRGALRAQGDPKGLGHAVLRAKMHVGHEPFAVLLGDDIIDERDVLLSRMLEVSREERQRRRAAGDRPRARAPVRCRHCSSRPTNDDVVRITDLVEKPEPGTAPSNLAVSAATCCSPRCSGCSSRPSRAAAARSS